MCVYGLAGLLGLLAFLYPLVGPALLGRGVALDDRLTPWLLTILISLCFLALLVEAQGSVLAPAGGYDAKAIALLGVLVAMNSVLRFAETAIPGPGGFSPIFFLIVLAGYVYGAGFGFLMGALTLLVSALVTGGVGPWLPYQMFAAGWVGLSAPLVRLPARRLGLEGRRGEAIVLAGVSALWGVLYGVLMNTWSWVFVGGTAVPLSAGEALRRYALFYAASSLPWDLPRAAGNAAMVLAFGAPTLRVLRRFRRRFAFTYEPAPEGGPVCTPQPG